MKVNKLNEDKKKKKQTGALLGIDPFHPEEQKKSSPILPDPEKSMDALNHSLGKDKSTNIGPTHPYSSGEGSGEGSSSSGGDGGCGESIINRGKSMTAKQIKESLRKLDHYALDEDLKYYDLLTLFESLEAELTDDDRAEISKLLKDKTKGYEEVNTYLTGVANRDKNDNKVDIKASVVDEDYIKSEYEMLNDICDEELELNESLNEGRNDLIAKKCVSIETHHTYWSPYDTKEKDYAKFGIRFRYEDRESCLEAINDPENDLGYNDKKPAKSEDEVKDESLLENKLTLEEGAEEEDTPENSGVNGVSQEEPDTFRFDITKNAIKKDGKIKIGALIAIKIYEYCKDPQTGKMGDTHYGNSREFINEHANAALITQNKYDRNGNLVGKEVKHTSQQNGQVFTDLGNAGLIDMGVFDSNGIFISNKGKQGGASSNSRLFPTDLLSNYIEGNNPDHINLYQYLKDHPEQDESSASRRKAQGVMLTRRNNVKVDGQDVWKAVPAANKPTINPQQGADIDINDSDLSPKVDVDDFDDWDVEESLQEDIKPELDDFMLNKAAKMKAIYKADRGLPEDYELTDNDLNGAAMQRLCVIHRWVPEQAMKLIWGK